MHLNQVALYYMQKLTNQSWLWSMLLKLCCGYCSIISYLQYSYHRVMYNMTFSSCSITMFLSVWPNGFNHCLSYEIVWVLLLIGGYFHRYVFSLNCMSVGSSLIHSSLINVLENVHHWKFCFKFHIYQQKSCDVSVIWYS